MTTGSPKDMWIDGWPAISLNAPHLPLEHLLLTCCARTCSQLPPHAHKQVLEQGTTAEGAGHHARRPASHTTPVAGTLGALITTPCATHLVPCTHLWRLRRARTGGGQVEALGLNGSLVHIRGRGRREGLQHVRHRAHLWRHIQGSAPHVTHLDETHPRTRKNWVDDGPIVIGARHDMHTELQQEVCACDSACPADLQGMRCAFSCVEQAQERGLLQRQRQGCLWYKLKARSELTARCEGLCVEGWQCKLWRTPGDELAMQTLEAVCCKWAKS